MVSWFFSGAFQARLPAAASSALNARVNAVLDTGMQNTQQRQSAIDWPEEYGRLDLMQSKCG